MAAAPPSGHPSESQRPLWLGLAAVAILALLWALRSIVILVAFSILLAYALDPLVSGIGRLRLPRGRRVSRGAASSVVILGLLALAGWLVSFGVPRLTAEFTGFLQRLPGNLQSLAGAARAWAAAQGLSAYVDPVVDGLRAQASSLAPQAGGLLLNWLGRAFGGLIQVFSLAVLPVLTFYLLAEREAVRSSVLRFMPEAWHRRVVGVGDAMDRALKSYVRGQGLVCLVMGTVTGLALAALGLPNAFLLGALVGAAEVIPFLGFATAAVAIVLTGYGVSLWHAMLGIGAYALINFLIGTFVTPRVMGRHLKMHPFVVTVSVLAGAELLGPPGVVLALPGAAVIQSLIEEFLSKPAPPAAPA
jgi:predicted PurR-regulated permease PerM